MHAVWSWLRELVALERDVSVEDAARVFTDAGFEVEGITAPGHDISGVVVARVVGKRAHPDADRLTLVDLIDRPDGTRTEVVCGANNVPDPGGLVLWAQPGAVLPGGFHIGKRTIKGVESAGMICSEDELGLGDDHDGIIVLGEGDARAGAIGDLLGDRDALIRLGIRDHALEIGVHANRPDALGHVGLARELAALLGGRLVDPDVDLAPYTDDSPGSGGAADLVTVAIDDPHGCPRYVARVLDGVTVRRSPLWLRQRLRAVGVRPISNLVDVTNYVMFHHGQPLHAFDHAAVRGAHIGVRRARVGERMTTLDDVERVLEPADLLICDGEGPVALAGVMGGKDSEVADTTTRVLLEAANFEPHGVRHTARRLHLHSEASHRFERGVDPNVTDRASRMAAALIAELGGGTVVRGAVDAYVRRIDPWPVDLRASRTSLLTGVQFTRDAAGAILERLGLGVADHPENADVLRVTCPTYRPDLTREVDLIEEVIRVHGVHRVPATLPAHPVARTRRVDTRPPIARRALVASGLSETLSFGFTSEERIAALGLPDSDRRSRPIRVRNPMTVDQAVMRSSLLPNLLDQVAHNVSFGVTDVALFEVGTVFLPRDGASGPAGSDGPAGSAESSGSSGSTGDGSDGLPHELRHVAGVMTGARPGWLRPDGPVDFYDIKGVVERLVFDLLRDRAGAVTYAADPSVPFMHPGVCASVTLDPGPSRGEPCVIGHVGEIHPATRAAFALEQPCFGFEIRLDAFPPPRVAQMAAMSRHPAITRDISLFLDETVTARAVRELIAASEPAYMDSVAVLEEYRDPDRVPAGKKGMLWSITYRADRTLTDDEVNKAHQGLEDRLLAALPGAQRR